MGWRRDIMEAVAEEIGKNEATLSPLKAIRKHCVECCCGQFVEVQLCPVNDCALHPYRFGKGPDVKPKLTALKSIREKCLDCSGGSSVDARECWNTECMLFSLRMGHNPNLKGKRGCGNAEGLRRWREMNSQTTNKETRRDSELRALRLVYLVWLC